MVLPGSFYVIPIEGTTRDLTLVPPHWKKRCIREGTRRHGRHTIIERTCSALKQGTQSSCMPRASELWVSAARRRKWRYWSRVISTESARRVTRANGGFLWSG